MRAPGLALVLAALLVAACGTQPRPPTPAVAAPAAAASAAWPEAARATPREGASGRVAGAVEEVLVFLPAPGDRFDAIAERFLTDRTLGWHVAQANPGTTAPATGQPLRVPLRAPAAHGVSAAGVQTITVLCYHRFGPGAEPGRSRMLMPAAQFEAQLEYLLREGWTVLRLADLQAFIEGRRALPPKSVLITVDDGWESFHRHAFPLLQRHGLPATLFVTTDIVGTRDGLSWAQLRELARSGLVEIQAHGKSHRNLTQPLPGESEAAWRRALREELLQPPVLLQRQLGADAAPVWHLAYPYGATNDAVLQALPGTPYKLAFTVRPGGNPFYAAPWQLRRTMIFGDHSLEDFAARLRPSERVAERPAAAEPPPAAGAGLAAWQAAERERARAASSRGDSTTARQAWSAVLALAPGDAEAADGFDATRLAQREGALALQRRALEARARGELDAAVSLHLRALALDPEAAASAQALREIEATRQRVTTATRPPDAVLPEEAQLLLDEGDIAGALRIVEPLAAASRAGAPVRQRACELLQRLADQLARSDPAAARDARARCQRLRPPKQALG